MGLNEQIYQIVVQCLEEWNEQQVRKIPIERGMDTPLYNKEGYLDSLGLVSVLVSIEQAVEDSLGQSIQLIREPDALAQKETPFKTVESLVGYISNLLAANS